MNQFPLVSVYFHIAQLAALLTRPPQPAEAVYLQPLCGFSKPLCLSSKAPHLHSQASLFLINH